MQHSELLSHFCAKYSSSLGPELAPSSMRRDPPDDADEAADDADEAADDADEAADDAAEEEEVAVQSGILLQIK